MTIVVVIKIGVDGAALEHHSHYPGAVPAGYSVAVIVLLLVLPSTVCSFIIGLHVCMHT